MNFLDIHFAFFDEFHVPVILSDTVILCISEIQPFFNIFDEITWSNFRNACDMIHRIQDQ